MNRSTKRLRDEDPNKKKKKKPKIIKKKVKFSSRQYSPPLPYSSRDASPVLVDDDVHRYCGTLNFSKLVDLLRKAIQTPFDTEINEEKITKERINNLIREIISQLDTSEKEKNNFLNQWEDYYQHRLFHPDFNLDVFENLKVPALLALLYTKEQSPAFRFAFIENFLNDINTAYDGAFPWTCPKGMMEQIILNLNNACTTEDNSLTCKKIRRIIGKVNNIHVANDLVQKWYQMYNVDEDDEEKVTNRASDWAQFHQLDENGKLNHLNMFLNNHPELEDATEEEKQFIQEKATEMIGELGIDRENFVYGGGGRRRRRRRFKTTRRGHDLDNKRKTKRVVKQKRTRKNKRKRKFHFL